MSKVLVDKLNVREGPSTSSKSVAQYDKGEIINSGNLLLYITSYVTDLIKIREGLNLRYKIF